MRLPVPLPPALPAQQPPETAGLAGQVAALTERVAQLSEQLGETRSQLQSEPARPAKPSGQRSRRKEGNGGA
jgi:hypothetical protein